MLSSDDGEEGQRHDEQRRHHISTAVQRVRGQEHA